MSRVPYLQYIEKITKAVAIAVQQYVSNVLNWDYSSELGSLLGAHNAVGNMDQ